MSQNPDQAVQREKITQREKIMKAFNEALDAIPWPPTLLTIEATLDQFHKAQAERDAALATLEEEE